MGRRRILIGILALSIGFLVQPLTVGSVLACSCVQDADPILTAARDPDQSVFTGVVKAPVAQGTPVVLTRWFGRAAPQAVVWLDNKGFEDPFAGMCGTARPPAETEWIFGAYRTEDGKFDVSLCSPHAALATDEGQRMLESVTAVLGPPVIPIAEPDQAGSTDSIVGAVIPIAVALVAAAGVLLGAFAVVGRRRNPEDEPGAG